MPTALFATAFQWSTAVQRPTPTCTRGLTSSLPAGAGVRLPAGVRLANRRVGIRVGVHERTRLTVNDRNVGLRQAGLAPLGRHSVAPSAETQGAEVNFPLIADPDRRVATLAK